jgi:serine/threonine protein kinase
VEDKVTKAYQRLHCRGVLHGDVRASNILISDDNSVYIIDFESSRIESEKVLDSEMLELNKLFHKIKRFAAVKRMLLRQNSKLSLRTFGLAYSTIVVSSQW